MHEVQGIELMETVSFIGCGNMGSALAEGVSRNVTASRSLIYFDRNPEKSQALSKKARGSAVHSIDEAVKEADFVVLAIKPKDFITVAAAIAPLIRPRTMIISLLAGISLQQLSEQFPVSTIVRAMPNMAVGCGKGVTGLVEDSQLSQAAKERVEALFKSTGVMTWLPENKIDALMALTACAPAFIAHIIESFVEGGIYMGLSAKQALPLVLSVFEGTLALLKENDLHPGVLRSQVASTGGTTIEGLKVLEEHKVQYAIIQALESSRLKSQKLSGK